MIEIFYKPKSNISESIKFDSISLRTYIEKIEARDIFINKETIDVLKGLEKEKIAFYNIHLLVIDYLKRKGIYTKEKALLLACNLTVYTMLTVTEYTANLSSSIFDSIFDSSDGVFDFVCKCKDLYFDELCKTTMYKENLPRNSEVEEIGYMPFVMLMLNYLTGLNKTKFNKFNYQ